MRNSPFNIKAGKVYRANQNIDIDCFRTNVEEPPIQMKKNRVTGKLVPHLDYLRYEGSSKTHTFSVSEVICVLEILTAYSFGSDGSTPDRWLVKTFFEDGQVGWLVMVREFQLAFDKID